MHASATTHWPRFFLAKIAFGFLALSLVAAGGFAVWYRGYYNTWPGQDARARVHWCERDYQNDSGSGAETWRQVSAETEGTVRDFGRYPPLGFPPQHIFAAVDSDSQPGSCTTVVYLRRGPDKYLPYELQGSLAGREAQPMSTRP